MKKIIYSILFTALTTGVAFAQDEEAATEEMPAVEEKAEKGGCCAGCGFTPKEGDIGVGINAAPFLQYVGSVVSNNGANAALNGGPVDWRGNGTNGLFARYFISDDMAVRATFIMHQFNNVHEASTQLDAVTNEDGALVTQNDRVTDKMAYSYTDFALGGGVEFRRGSKRLQGYYGGEVMFTRDNGARVFYDYGNEMTNANYNPITHDFSGENINIGGTNVTPALLGLTNNALGNTRILEEAAATTVGMQFNGLLGVEWFFAKKMSLGSELKWGYYFSRTAGNASVTAEFMENGVRKVEEFKSDQGTNRYYGFQPAADAQVWMSFYF